MKVFSIIVYNCSDEKKPAIITSVVDLAQFGFFKRGTVRDLLFFVSRELTSRTHIGDKQTITHKLKEEIDGVSSLNAHAHINVNKIGAAVITDGDYPLRVAYSVLDKAMESAVKEYGDKISSIHADANLSPPLAISSLIVEYQKPDEVDKMMKIQKDLDETKGVILSSIDKLLERGESLDNLMQKSNDLNFQSKIMLDKSKDLNSCCTII